MPPLETRKSLCSRVQMCVNFGFFYHRMKSKRPLYIARPIEHIEESLRGVLQRTMLRTRDASPACQDHLSVYLFARGWS